jgi:hypothetical protein
MMAVWQEVNSKYMVSHHLRNAKSYRQMTAGGRYDSLRTVCLNRWQLVDCYSMPWAWCDGFLKYSITQERISGLARRPELEFLKSLWGLGTEEEQGYRTGPPGYIGWRNSFLESIPGPHKHLKVRALLYKAVPQIRFLPGTYTTRS